MKLSKSLVWFRRDLRAFDHAALHHALRASRQVFCVFVYDTDILDGLPHDACGPLIQPANDRPAEAPGLPPGPEVTTLAGTRVVLTGELASLGRDEAVAALLRCGARRQAAPNRLTDFVVMGAAPGPAKLRAIRQLQQEHGRPRVLPEAVFLQLIDGRS